MIALRGVHDLLLDVSSQAVESLLDVDIALCRDFEERNAEFISELLSSLGGDCSLLFPVAFVSDQNFVDTLAGMLFDV